MDHTPTILEPLFEKIEQYGADSLKLYKLKTVDKSAHVLASVFTRGTVFLFFAMILLFLNIAASLWLGEVTGKSYYGFLWVAAINFFVGIVFYIFFFKSIKRQVINTIVKHLLN